MNIAALIFVCILAVVSANESCDRRWKKVGCFKDKLKLLRSLSNELVNRRDRTNPNFDGHMINWKNYPDSLHSLYCKCAKIAEERGFTHFGLQFYGECWGGSLGKNRFAMYGNSKKCIGVDFQPCIHSAESECIGGQSENYIYQLKQEEFRSRDLPKIDGGYSPWTSWGSCSKSCGGGTRFRNRLCNKPVPLNNGKDCTELGPAEEIESCNKSPCQNGCKRIFDIGIIMDASSSVRRRNYLKMKLFIKAMVDDFGVSASGTHFGIIHYSSFARLDFTPSDSRYHDPNKLKAKVSSIVYSYGGTRTDKALRLAEKKFFCDSCRRDGIPQILLVITDGNTNQGSEDLGIASKNMKDSGVIVLSLGVGKGISMSELELIASEPKSEHVFKCTDFDDLKAKLKSIIGHMCISKIHK